MQQPVVIVTGGSRGIGAATAKLFADNGYAVCINYKSDGAAAETLLSDLKSREAPCIAIKADVSAEEGTSKLFEAVDAEFGRLDVLVNNVGILKTQSKLVDMNADRINALLINNVTSHFLCSREAVKRMSTQSGGAGGTIVNVSPGAARTGSPNEYIDYAATKGAIDTLTRGLAMEVAAEGIRVNGVRPGLIYTDMHADGGEPDRIERLKSKVPLNRGGQPEEVAQAIFWLASDKSSFSTGSILDVSGGL
ncbi:SDR family oxidoreductase [Alteromonadaceae bacterium M269]|nr:SDR family oxidoreductase [Alteromonadaceae bacterium M269]